MNAQDLLPINFEGWLLVLDLKNDRITRIDREWETIYGPIDVSSFLNTNRFQHRQMPKHVFDYYKATIRLLYLRKQPVDYARMDGHNA